jgi:hypothetical protein
MPGRGPKPVRFNIDISNLNAVTREAIVTLAEAEVLSSLSPDTWRDQHPDKIVHLSPRRDGVRLKHALFLED